MYKLKTLSSSVLCIIQKIQTNSHKQKHRPHNSIKIPSVYENKSSKTIKNLKSALTMLLFMMYSYILLFLIHRFIKKGQTSQKCPISSIIQQYK